MDKRPHASHEDHLHESRGFQVGLLLFCLVVILVVLARRPVQMPGRLSVIVDTDGGTDDLIAISYLLSRPEVDIRAVTSVNGIAHAEAAAHNVLRLLRAANKRADVFLGSNEPLEGRDSFPAEWRQQADEMTVLPPLMGRRARPDAITAIIDKIKSSENAVTLLALGPLTNIASACERDPRTLAKISNLVIMGGAIEAAGNAPGDRSSPVAEWNMFIDPTAASIVMRSGLPITLVPLDATSRVPIDRKFEADFNANRLRTLGSIVGQLLSSAGQMLDSHQYFAWDPLAAVAVIEPRVISTRQMQITVIRTGDDRGRTVASADGDANANVNVAYTASPQIFRRAFFTAFALPRGL